MRKNKQLSMPKKDRDRKLSKSGHQISNRDPLCGGCGAGLRHGVELVAYLGDALAVAAQVWSQSSFKVNANF